MRSRSGAAKRLVWVVAAGAIPSTVAGQAGEVRRVTLDEAVRLATEQHFTVVQARGELDVEEARRRETVGSWLPRLSASSGMSKSSSTRYNPATGQNVTASSPFSYSAGLSASVVLFDGLRRLHEGRTASANIARAEATLTDQRSQVALLTKQAFYDVVHATELERLAEGQVERAQRQLELSKARLAAGTVIRSDTLRATVELGNARLGLVEASAVRATGEVMLARMIGVDQAIAIVIDSAVLAMPELDTAAVRDEARIRAPAVARADAELAAREAEVSVALAQRFPTVSAGFSTTRSGTALDALNPSWSLGFSLSWSLFDGFTRDGRVTGARAQLRTAAAAAADMRREVGVQLTEQLANLATARAQLDIALTSRVAAEEDVRVQEDRYRQGIGSILEVLQAQQGFDQTERAAVDARRAYHVARATIEAIVGKGAVTQE